MSEPNNFLTRWSRRKRQQAAGEKRTDALPPNDVQPAKDAGIDQAVERPAALVETTENFDPSSLPSIESIDAQTDISDFLRPGVPEEMRKAAMRRAWSVDPAIRNFKGLQENDWDFNDPNGIPGFGPLDPGLDVRKMAAALFRGAPEQSSTEAVGQSAPVEATDQKSTLESVKTAGAESRAESDAALQKDSEATVAAPTQRKRSHGSALPES